MTEVIEAAHVSKDLEESKRPGTKERKKVKIRYSIFIDGTLNNRTNTLARSDGRKTARGTKGARNTGSYANDLSNVATMELHVKQGDNQGGYDKMMASYTEGMGTHNLGGDSVRGSAFGSGDSGVTARAIKALGTLVTDLQNAYDSAHDICIEKLTIDAFGFSRGAAAARYLLHAVYGLKMRGRNAKTRRDSLKVTLERRGFEVGEIELSFIGLFDTVSSIGTPGQHKYNAKKFHLNAISKAKTVFQLAAAEEHRENFSLTNIKSAGSKGKEVFLPGVHSDIGGGYVDNSEEDLVLFESGNKDILTAERQRLIDEGWFQDGEISVKDPGWVTDGSVKGTRMVRARYHRVSLYIMTDNAVKAGMMFENKLKNANPIDSELNDTYSTLDSYAKKGGSSPHHWHQRQGADVHWLHTLRGDDLHFSSHYNTTAGILKPMKPRFNSAGKRHREIYDG